MIGRGAFPPIPSRDLRSSHSGLSLWRVRCEWIPQRSRRHWGPAETSPREIPLRAPSKPPSRDPEGKHRPSICASEIHVPVSVSLLPQPSDRRFPRRQVYRTLESQASCRPNPCTRIRSQRGVVPDCCKGMPWDCRFSSTTALAAEDRGRLGMVSAHGYWPRQLLHLRPSRPTRSSHRQFRPPRWYEQIFPSVLRSRDAEGLPKERRRWLREGLRSSWFLLL